MYGGGVTIQKHIWVIVLCLLCFVGGCLTGDYYADKQSITVEKEKPVYVKGETVTKTEIVYVPKESGERADMTADIGKTDFTIQVNGQEQTFTKTDDEKYVFDKNKLSLTQTSRIAVDVAVPTVDKTKRWAVGVGYGENGMAYTVDFPVGKSDTFGGWVYKDDDSHAVGVKIKF